jgi:serine-type D-Ala-D-Ala carboxypeptidase/endopeptidase
MDKSLIARKLLSLRKQRGLSQEQLANLSGVALRTIQRIETEKVNAHPQTYQLLAKALDVPFEDFMPPGENPTEKEESNRRWLILMHVLPILGSVIPSGSLLAPLALWIFKRKEDADLDVHGRAVINFQLSMLIVLILAILSMFVIFPPIGIALMLLSIPYNIVMVGINTWRVSEGKSYRYPLSLRIFSRPGIPIVALLVVVVTTPVSSQSITRLDGSTIQADSLSRHISALIKKAQVTGLELAVLNKNKVVFKQAFGLSNSKTKKPLETNTSIYGASLSKAVFGVIVMRLVEEKVLDLDKPLQSYLPKPIYDYSPRRKWHDNYSDLRTDTLYSKITARMCLDHTSGFPNWRFFTPDQKLRVAFIPGTRYSYSGEGMVYLQTVIEKITGKNFEDLADQMIFKPFKMTNSAYHWVPAYEADYADGHDFKGGVLPRDKDNEPRAPSTLETTFDDYVSFVSTVMQGKALKQSSQNEMFKPQIRIRSLQQIGPLAGKDSTLNDDISLSYGLGWGLLRSPYGWGAFKEGHGSGFVHYSILFPKNQIAVVIMTNNERGSSIFKELLELSIADKYTPWKWQNYIPYDYKE